MSTRSESEPRKVALVTGGARRIGAAIVRCLHDEGMNVAVHYRTSRDDAHALCEELNTARPASALPFEADLRDATAIDDLAGAVSDAFTRTDVLVNNASSFLATPLGAVDDAAYGELLDTNLKAPLFLAQALVPRLRESNGCIVNITDIYGSTPLIHHAVYCAAKAGLIMLTRSLALDLAPDIRVNAISPGAILWPASDPEDMDRSALLAQIPLRRTGEPADIAQGVLFLVRDAHYMTGQVIKVDGGRAIG